MSQEGSRESISAIDEIIEYTTQVQGRIGSSMNTLDSVLGNNTQTQINLTDSNSRLIDADVAKERAKVVKTQIRQNMTASLLAQTGTNMSQIVLALYGL
jgi:flagellin